MAKSNVDIKIPPCVVGKELSLEIGRILEEEVPCKGCISYTLYTESKKISVQTVDDFVGMEWGSDIESITIETHRPISGQSAENKSVAERGVPDIKIHFSFRYPESHSKLRISGFDGTLVNNLAKRIDGTFKKRRPEFYQIRENFPLLLAFSVLTTAILVCPVALVWIRLVWSPTLAPIMEQGFPLYLNDVILIIAVASPLFLIPLGAFFGILIFMIWAFPYFDHEGTRRKPLRRWVLLLIYCYGLISTIVLKLIGF